VLPISHHTYARFELHSRIHRSYLNKHSTCQTWQRETLLLPG